jgi:ParB/RepB/Spo0J family partition protein
MPRSRKTASVKSGESSDELEQSPLIPQARPKQRLKMIDVTLIDCEGIAPAPEPALQDNVKHWGVFEPLVLQEYGEGRYHVLSGRRRLMSAVYAGDAKVPASVTDAPAEIVQLAAHALRRENVIADLHAAVRLLKERFDSLNPIDAYREIAKRLGLPVPKLKKLLLLQTLIVELQEDLAKGDLKRNVAEAICRAELNPDEQLQLHQRLQGRGKLSIGDVQQLRAAAAEAQQLPGMPEPVAAPVDPPHWIDARTLRPNVSGAIQRLELVLADGTLMVQLAKAAVDREFREAVEMLQTTYAILAPGEAPVAEAPDSPNTEATMEATDEPHDVSAVEFSDRLQRIADEVAAEREQELQPQVDAGEPVPYYAGA